MRVAILFFILIIGHACEKKAGDVSISEVDNDFKDNDTDKRKSKTINGYTITVTHEVEKRNRNGDQTDQSLHFIMEIKADGNYREGNFLYHDVNGVGDFKNNVNYFNFDIINDVSVMADGTSYNVVLSNMENTYTLEDSRKIHFVAVPSEETNNKKSADQISFVYDDEVLGVGRIKFTFQAEKV